MYGGRITSVGPVAMTGGVVAAAGSPLWGVYLVIGLGALVAAFASVRTVLVRHVAVEGPRGSARHARQ